MFVVMYVYILVAKPRAECVETKARPRLWGVESNPRPRPNKHSSKK